MTRGEMLEALSANGLDKFFVEFRGYFSNHLSQACVALHHLGASKERFSAFVEHYTRQLEPAAGPTRRAQDAGLDLAGVTVAELRGGRRGFYKVRQHYAILLRERYGDRAVDLLRGEFPSLALGISGASLHCLEDLGYAACAGLWPQMVVDALAYLHHSFCPNFITIPRWNISKHGSLKSC